MTKSQKLALERSEKTQAINALLAKESLTDDERGELDSLSKRAQEIEPEYRAAVVAEDGELAETRAAAGDGLDKEARERIELRSKASLGTFFRAALTGKTVTGAEAELQAAAAVDGIPIEMWELKHPLIFSQDGEHSLV